jgi:extradiol dioxygenase family protein
MFGGNCDHLVLKVENISAIRRFYEGVVGLEAVTVQDKYVTYKLGNFSICFKEFHGGSKAENPIVHLGIEFKTRGDIDVYFKRVNDSSYSPKPSTIVGGPGEGPYRFYVNDPSGYTLEFESWEDASD